MPTVEFGPLIVQRLVRDIPQSKWDEKTGPGRFTLREAVSHLADWEPIWLERFKKGLESPGARIIAYDEGQFAIDRDYASRNPNKEADRFVQGRKVVAELLREMTPEQFKITIDHPERGIISLEDLANMLLGHDMYHIEHLTQYIVQKTAATW